MTSWNGGPHLKDRVGQGARDEHAEIRVDNLALGILGGIQPDRLAALRDLTSDGLLQRFLPVLMRSAERGNECHPVSVVESNYGQLIRSVQAAPACTMCFASDAEEVRKRVLDRLFELEQVQGFPSVVIGAVGKLKGYFGRLALTLHVAGEHRALVRGQPKPTGLFPPARLPRLPNDCCSSSCFPTFSVSTTLSPTVGKIATPSAQSVTSSWPAIRTAFGLPI